MCKYCNQMFSPSENYELIGMDDIKTSNGVFLFGLEIGMIRDFETMEPTLFASIENEEATTISEIKAKISYCPFCGKKL